MAMHTSHESDHDSKGLPIKLSNFTVIKYEDMLNDLMSQGLDETQAKYILKETGYQEGDAVARNVYFDKINEVLGGKSVEDWQKDVWNPMQSPTQSSEDVVGETGTYTNAVTSISDTVDEDTANTIAKQISTTEEGQATNAEDAQAKAKAARLSAASAGLGNTRAGLLGSLTGSNENNGQTYAAANRNLQQSTQNDYLNKMGQAEALDMQAENMRKGAALNAVSGGLQGAASGAMAGFVISDETQKEAPSNNLDEAKLQEQINQFRILYKRVKELRSKK